MRWRDETTLKIAPDHAPDAWRPAHIYGRGGCEGMHGFWAFVLTRRALMRDALDQLDDVFATLAKARDLIETGIDTEEVRSLLDSLEHTAERLVETVIAP